MSWVALAQFVKGAITGEGQALDILLPEEEQQMVPLNLLLKFYSMSKARHAILVQ